MRTLSLAALALLAACNRSNGTNMVKKPGSADGGQKEDPDRPGRLTLTISERRDERSMDSNSSQSVWQVSGHQVTLDESSSGAYSSAPVSSKGTLTDADLDHLAKVLADNGLLADQTVTTPESQFQTYAITIDVTLDGKSAHIALTGGDDVPNHPLRNSLVMVTSQLRRMITGGHVGALEISAYLHRQEADGQATDTYYELLGNKLDVSVVIAGEVDTSKNRYSKHQLSDAEIAELTKVVNDKGLLESATVDKGEPKGVRGLAGGTTVKLAGKGASISVNGPTDSVKGDPAYKRMEALFKAMDKLDEKHR